MINLRIGVSKWRSDSHIRIYMHLKRIVEFSPPVGGMLTFRPTGLTHYFPTHLTCGTSGDSCVYVGCFVQ